MGGLTVVTATEVLEHALKQAIAEEAEAVDLIYAPDGPGVYLERDGQREELGRFPPSQWEPLRRLIGERAGLAPGEDPYQRALVFTHPYRDQLYFVAAEVGPTAIRLVPSLAPPAP